MYNPENQIAYQDTPLCDPRLCNKLFLSFPDVAPIRIRQTLTPNQLLTAWPEIQFGSGKGVALELIVRWYVFVTDG